MRANSKMPPGRATSVQGDATAVASIPTTPPRPAGSLGIPARSGPAPRRIPDPDKTVAPSRALPQPTAPAAIATDSRSGSQPGPVDATRYLPAEIQYAPASLETLETSAQGPAPARHTRPWPAGLPPQTDLQDTIHEPHRKIRDRIILDLHPSPAELDRKTAYEMAGCADLVRFYVDPDAGKVRPWLHRCRKRLCPLCGQQRSRKAAHQIHDVAELMKDPRHMILTMQSSDEPLGIQLDRLQAALKKLRRTHLWLDAVIGGIVVTEVSWNPRSGQWHPHLHILYDGRFILQRQLAAEWAKATDGSYVVWLRRCDSTSAIAEELSKYISKPANLTSVPPTRLSEFNQATHRRRMLNKFGSCYRAKVTEDDPLIPLGPNTFSVSICRIMFLAKQGAGVPQQLLVTLASRYPTFQSYVYHAMPQLAAPAYPTDRTLDLRKGVVSLSSARPPPYTKSREADVELLDAALFLAFTEFRQLDNAGHFARFDYRA